MLTPFAPFPRARERSRRLRRSSSPSVCVAFRRRPTAGWPSPSGAKNIDGQCLRGCFGDGAIPGGPLQLAMNDYRGLQRGSQEVSCGIAASRTIPPREAHGGARPGKALEAHNHFVVPRQPFEHTLWRLLVTKFWVPRGNYATLLQISLIEMESFLRQNIKEIRRPDIKGNQRGSQGRRFEHRSARGLE